LNKISDSKIETIVRLYKEGATTREIADAVGCNRNTVSDYLRKIQEYNESSHADKKAKGVRRHHQRRKEAGSPVFPPWHLKRISARARKYNLFGQDLTLLELEEATGVKSTVLWRRIEQHGITVEEAVFGPKDRRKHQFEVDGEILSLKELSRRSGLCGASIHNRLKKGQTLRDVVARLPVDRGKRYPLTGQQITVRTLAGMSGVHVDTVRQRLSNGMTPEEIAATPKRQSRLNLAGQRFGLLVVERVGPKQYGKIHWHCLCDCGKKALVSPSNLKSGATRSCGCLHSKARARLFTWDGTEYTLRELAQITGVSIHKIRAGLSKGLSLERVLTPVELKTGSQRRNLIGQTFGRLTVTSRSGENKYGCVCQCGAEVSRCADTLLRGGQEISCGCHRRKKETPKPQRKLNLIGQTFGSLTVEGYASSGWVCRCTCGNELNLPTKTLRRKGSCRCLKTYEVFGQRLTLREMAELSGIKPETIRHRVLSYKMMPEEAISRAHTNTSHGIKNRYKGKPITLRQIAKLSGLSIPTVMLRIKSGITVEELCGT
jgi:DNA-binding transcriptional regulator YhcF (GntR family)